MPDLVSKIAVRATVHISANIFADIAVVIFCPSLLAVAAILIPQHITHLCKARYLWGYHYAADVTPLLVTYHLLSTLMAILAAYFRCRALREQWLVRFELANANAERIEQLAREKERLDYERAFALKKHAETQGASPRLASCSPRLLASSSLRLILSSHLALFSSSQACGQPAPARPAVGG